MSQYISHFDFLGYKNLILANDDADVERIVNAILVNIEMSLGQGVLKRTENKRIHADLSNSKINCLNISDTVLFWTNDDSVDSLIELLNVTFEFNWRCNSRFFPVRGCMIYSDIKMITGLEENQVGGTYNVNMIYGKGLVKAHIKGDSVNWAGSVIDKSIIVKLSELMIDVDAILNQYTFSYNVPYKEGVFVEEYAFKLTKQKLNNEHIKNVEKGIIGAFESFNKDANHERAKEMLANTLEFLKLHKE